MKPVFYIVFTLLLVTLLLASAVRSDVSPKNIITISLDSTTLMHLHGFTQILQFGQVVPIAYDDFSGGIYGWNIMKEDGGDIRGSVSIDANDTGLWNSQVLKMSTSGAPYDTVEINKPFGLNTMPSPVIGITFMLSLGTLTNLNGVQFFVEYFYNTAPRYRSLNIVSYGLGYSGSPIKWSYRVGNGTGIGTDMALWNMTMTTQSSGLGLSGWNGTKNLWWIPCLLIVDTNNFINDPTTANTYMAIGLGNQFYNLTGTPGGHTTDNSRITAVTPTGWFGVDLENKGGSTACTAFISDVFIFELI